MSTEVVVGASHHQGRSGVGDKEDCSEDDEEGVERGVVNVEEGEEGDETLEDVNVEEIEAGVREVYPRWWLSPSHGNGKELVRGQKQGQ